MRQKKIKYYIENTPTNPKDSFYSNVILKCATNNGSPKAIKVNGETIIDQTQIAHEFNKFLSSLKSQSTICVDDCKLFSFNFFKKSKNMRYKNKDEVEDDKFVFKPISIAEPGKLFSLGIS